MAKNYKVSKFKITNKKGSIPDNTEGNIPSKGIIVITPNAGYVVSASSFSHGTLPDNVRTCTFSDTSTAGVIGNTVKVEVNLAYEFVLNNSTTINIKINGDAVAYNTKNDKVDVNVIIEDETNPNATSSPTVTFTAATSSFTVNQSTTAPTTEPGNIKRTTTTISGTTTKNLSTKIATLKIESPSGYYIDKSPYLKYVNSLENVKLIKTSIARDNEDRITTYDFDVMFISEVDTKANSGAKIFLIYNTIITPVITKEITRIDYGRSFLTADGGNRKILIQGETGAEFDVTVTDAVEGDSILSTYNANSTIFDPIKSEITAINHKFKSRLNRRGNRGAQRFKFNQNFPAYNNTILTTAIDMGSGLSGTTATFNELTNVRVGDRLVMDEISTGTKVTVTKINSARECVLSSSVTADDDAVAVFTRQQEYHINIFPKNGTTLASSISTTTPTCTIKQYKNPVLKLTATAGTNYTLTTYSAISYTGRPNASVNSLSHIKDIPKIFSISIVATRSGGHTFTTANNPSWSSTDSTASHWSNSVYNDVTDEHGNVTDGNGGTHIEIFNAKTVKSSGDTIATITADVIIKNFGTEDVTMNLDTSQFLTSS